MEKTRQEPLCLSYELFVDQKDPGHFTFIETWPDRAALDAHCATAHFQRLVPLIDRHQSQPGQFLLMDLCPGTTLQPAASAAAAPET